MNNEKLAKVCLGQNRPECMIPPCNSVTRPKCTMSSVYQYLSLLDSCPQTLPRSSTCSGRCPIQQLPNLLDPVFVDCSIILTVTTLLQAGGAPRRAVMRAIPSPGAAVPLRALTKVLVPGICSWRRGRASWLAWLRAYSVRGFCGGSMYCQLEKFLGSPSC
jgi:hypothetical protein